MAEIRTALVCSSDPALEGHIRQAGFRTTRASSCGEALPRVLHERWDVVVTDATTGRDTMLYLTRLGGMRRREMFLVKVGKPFATGDRLQAWSESADLVVHEEDAAQLGALVEEWMRDRNEFTRRFRELQAESGTRLGAHA